MMPTNIPATNGHDTWSTPGPGRGINVDILLADVQALCAKNKTTISSIEALPKGGTRVVMMNGDDAATMRRVFGKKVIEGVVQRQHWLRAPRP